MTQRTPLLHPPPDKYRPPRPTLLSRQEPMSPLPNSVTWIIRIPRPVANLYTGQGWMRRDLGEEIQG